MITSDLRRQAESSVDTVPVPVNTLLELADILDAAQATIDSMAKQIKALSDELKKGMK